MDPNLDRKFPSAYDIERHALKRLPKFIGEYIAYGMGRGGSLRHNRAALDRVRLTPRYNVNCPIIDTRCELLGKTYAAPFGISPVGLGGLAWPKAPELLASSANKLGIPFAAATFALSSLESLKTEAGEMGWLQLYRPNKPEVEDDILSRAEAAGYQTLIVTADIPAPMRRDHDIRNGFSLPLKLTPKTLVQLATHPAWSLAMGRHTLLHGFPTFKTLQPYVPEGLNNADALAYMSELILGYIDPVAMKSLRSRWPGKLLVKGILSPEDALAYRDQGADGIVVSNHGGRQLEAAPSPVDVLPMIRRAVGPDYPIIADSGIRSGLDICRMLALGADFVMLGRPCYYALAAMGAAGANHIIELFLSELECVMGQLGCAKVREINLRLADSC